MTRKDTIIVAALINAGLLIVLCVSAVRDLDSLDVETSPSAPVVEKQISAKIETKPVLGNEIEQVLKQYTQVDPMPVVIQTAEASIAKPFIEDLQAVTASPKVSLETEPMFQECKVKKGDALEKIARSHGTSVSEIMKLNQLTSSQLKVGQVLKIPTKQSEKKEVEKVFDEVKYYTVKPGDNPWTIAVKNHMKVEELLRINQMSEEKARKLRPGDQIRIR